MIIVISAKLAFLKLNCLKIKYMYLTQYKLYLDIITMQISLKQKHFSNWSKKNGTSVKLIQYIIYGD